MIAKIFTKRKPGGQPVETGLRWINKYIETNTVCSRIDENKATLTTMSDETEYTHTVNLDTHGFELYNDAGVMIEKYVTPLNEEE